MAPPWFQGVIQQLENNLRNEIQQTHNNIINQIQHSHNNIINQIQHSHVGLFFWFFFFLIRCVFFRMKFFGSSSQASSRFAFRLCYLDMTNSTYS